MSQLGSRYSPVPCLGLRLGGRSPPLPASGRWPLSPAHLPVCQRAALNSGELLGRTGSSANPNSKRKPHGGVRQPWERGSQRRRAPGAGWQKESPHPLSPPAAGRASLPLLPRATTGNWPREQEQILQKAPSLGFGRLRARRAAAGEPVSGALERVHRFLPEVLSFRFPLLKRCQGLGNPLLLPSPPMRTCPQPPVLPFSFSKANGCSGRPAGVFGVP